MLAAPERNAVLERLLDHICDGGWVLVADEASNIEDFKAAIAAHDANWNTTLSLCGHLLLHRS
ncbi:hypothetical protein ACOTTU_22520 [Roseobacter sp. EG26]|uniref:hypothetical protein n=1 Tax=Roseobacter sp. EG26 TaxID=3412477 RepID=UPI003CE48F22